jgi:hypothetical protein
MIRLKHQNGTTSPVVKTFSELSLVALPETERAQLTTLRKRRVDHLLATWRTWAIVISTEAAVNDVLAVNDFWTAERRWIQSPYDANDALNWIEVTTAGGRAPITYIDGIVMWPEAALELYAKEPD